MSVHYRLQLVHQLLQVLLVEVGGYVAEGVAHRNQHVPIVLLPQSLYQLQIATLPYELPCYSKQHFRLVLLPREVQQPFSVKTLKRFVIVVLDDVYSSVIGIVTCLGKGSRLLDARARHIHIIDIKVLRQTDVVAFAVVLLSIFGIYSKPYLDYYAAVGPFLKFGDGAQVPAPFHFAAVHQIANLERHPPLIVE